MTENKKTKKPEAFPNTVRGFVLAMERAETCRDIRWNEFTESPVILDRRTGRTRPVTDEYRSGIVTEIEERFGLFSLCKFDHAFRVFYSSPERSYHPIKERIESIEYDGGNHISESLVKILNVSPSPYAAEAARLLFAGGIRCLYEPGCKCDYVVTLIGTKQGEGKSTFLRWLAMNDDWYGELKAFDFQKGAEALIGKWIVEIPELAALRRAEVEEAKAFISQQRDHYRRPYERTPSDLKRKCVMAGTTNCLQFLTDPTGNRRFLPIQVGSDGADLFRREAEIKAEIEQCWAEAYSKRSLPFMLPAPRAKLLERIEREQEAATVDDPELSLIMTYLDGKRETCVLEIFYDAFSRSSYERPTKADRNQIGALLQKAGWRRNGQMYPYTKPYPNRQHKWTPAGRSDSSE